MWPVMANERAVGIAIQVIEAAPPESAVAEASEEAEASSQADELAEPADQADAN